MAKLSDPHPQPIPDRTHAQGKDAISGHPTCRGPRDPYVPRVGLQTVRDGQPGIPKVRPGRYGFTGSLSNTARTIMRQDVIYDSPDGVVDENDF
jgi:hypothetical protein